MAAAHRFRCMAKLSFACAPGCRNVLSDLCLIVLDGRLQNRDFSRAAMEATSQPRWLTKMDCHRLRLMLD